MNKIFESIMKKFYERSLFNSFDFVNFEITYQDIINFYDKKKINLAFKTQANKCFMILV